MAASSCKMLESSAELAQLTVVLLSALATAAEVDVAAVSAVVISAAAAAAPWRY